MVSELLVCTAASLGTVDLDHSGGAQQIAPFEVHEYVVQLPSAGIYGIAAQHDSADIVLTIKSEDCAEISMTDIRYSEVGIEYAILSVPAAAQFIVEVANGEGGDNDSYELLIDRVAADRVEASKLSSDATAFAGSADARVSLHERAIDAWQALGDLGEQARLYFSLGSHRRTSNELALAQENYETAADLWEQSGKTRQALWSRYNAGVMLASQDQLNEALVLFGNIFDQANLISDYELAGASRNYEALILLSVGKLQAAHQLFLELSDFLEQNELRHRLATVLHNIGGTYNERGEPAEAIAYFQRAIDLAQEINPNSNVSAALEEIGAVYARTGHCDLAFVYLNTALQALTTASPATGRVLPSKRAEGRILNRIGNCHRQLSDLDNATEYYTSSLKLREESGDKRGYAYTVSNLGDVRREQGDYDRALEIHLQAAKLHTERDDLLGYTASLIAIGHDKLMLERFEEALDASSDALESAEANRYGGHQANALKLTGDANAGLRNIEAALASYDLALAAYRRMDNATGEIETLTAKAELLTNTGDHSLANQQIHEAIAVAESVRADIGSAELRTSFTAALQRLYLLSIDVLVAQVPEEGLADYASQTLRLNDQRRARVFREQQILSLTARAENSMPDDARRYRALRDELNAKLHKRQNLSNQDQPSSLSELANQINRIRLELLDLESTIADANPGWQSIVNVPEMDITAVQALIATDTVVLDFALSSNATYVWLITDSSVELQLFDPLPPALDILDTENRGVPNSLLEPIFRDIANRYPERTHLTVIPDGLINFIPLASISLDENTRVVDRFSINLTPALALVGPRAVEPSRFEKVALVGEPTFRKELLFGSASGYVASEITRAMREFEIDTIAPLPYSGFEIEGISKVAADRETLLLRGQNANKTRVMLEVLTNYDVAHFATHGFVNMRVPELSGLVFALVDSEGSPIDGFMDLHDVYSLQNIDASIVVLSGCQTAVGKHMRGEGAVSLARAFMVNGVEHVLASQWEVSDRATAELMIEFYRGLLEESLSPAEALAYAQREIKQNPRWSDPYYWASFSLWSAHAEANQK